MDQDPLSQQQQKTQPALRNRNLLQIGADLVAILQLVDEEEGSLDAADGALDKYLTETIGEASWKLDQYVRGIKHLELEGSALEAQGEQFEMMADNFFKRAKTRDNRIKRMKENIKMYLESTGQTKAITDTGFVISLRRNGGSTPVVFDETKVPPNLWSHPKPYVDKDVIRSYLVQLAAENKMRVEAGLETILCDFASWGDPGKHVTIS